MPREKGKISHNVILNLLTLEYHIGDINALGLFQESFEVSNHSAGHIAYNSRESALDAVAVN